jgi:hypothetical protein
MPTPWSRIRISTLPLRLLVVALSVGSGPPSAASIRLFVAARLLANVSFHFRVVHRDPQSREQQKDTPADAPQT